MILSWFFVWFHWRPSIFTLAVVGWRNICELPWFLQESSGSCYFLLCYSHLWILYFEVCLIHNSSIRDFKEWLAKSVRIVPFSAKYLTYRHVQTDWLQSYKACCDTLLCLIQKWSFAIFLLDWRGANDFFRKYTEDTHICVGWCTKVFSLHIKENHLNILYLRICYVKSWFLCADPLKNQ